MKTISLAKKLWDYAYSKQRQPGHKPSYAASTLYSYYGILTMYAAAQAAYATKDEEWMSQVVAMQERYPFDFESPELYFRYNFDNYRVGGMGKPWLMLRGYFSDEHKEEVRKYAEKTLAAPQSWDGIMCNPHCPQDEKIWIDTVFTVTPYMLYAGLLLKEDKYIDFAVDQCFKMYDVFMDRSNGLLHQARGFMGDKTTISHDHWSRGNGWGYIGLTELVRYLPKDSKYYNEAVERYIAHTEAMVKYQDHRGLWRQSIAEPLAWEEESGSGIILYGIGVGMRLGLLDKEKYMPVLYKGVAGLMEYCINDDYSIDRCCHGCLCPGATPERKGTIEAYLVDVAPRRNDGHAFGPAIMALTEAYRNGIVDVPWRTN